MSWDFERRSLLNALLITVPRDRKKVAIWLLDAREVGSQMIRLQAIPAQMSFETVLGWVTEEVLRKYENLAHDRRLQVGDRSVRQVGAGSDRKAVMDLAGPEGSEGPDDDDDSDERAETAVCAFVAINLHKGSNRGSWIPIQQGRKKREKKEPRRVGDPPLSFAEFIRANPQHCVVCYGRSSPFQHDHQTCPIHKADTEA